MRRSPRILPLLFAVACGTSTPTAEVQTVRIRHTEPITLDGLNQTVEGIGRIAAAITTTTTTTTTRPVPVTTRPPVVHTTPPVPSTSGCGYEAQIRATFGTAGDWAVRIAMRESRCTPTAKSPTGCWGLFQLCVPLHLGIFRHVCPELTGQVGNAVALDPACNIAAAKHLYDGAGTRPWAL